MTRNLAGAGFMVLSMVGFAMEDALFKAATASASAGIATLIFGAGGFVLFALVARRAGEPLWSPAFLAPSMLWRTGFEITGRLFFALALAYAPLSTTSAILQAAPLVVTLGAALVLKEHVGPARWIAMAVGFAGVLLILRPGQDADPALAFAVLGMIGFAGRDLATRASPPALSARQLGLPGFAVIAVAGLIITLFEPRASAPNLVALGCLAGTITIGVLAYMSLTSAMRTGEVSVVAPFRYSRLLVALLIAYLLFGERPDATMYLGAFLIVSSGVVTLLRSNRAPIRSPRP